MSRRYPGTRAGSNKAVLRARGEAGWRSARTSQAGPPVYAGDVVWSCPACGTDLDDGWCGACETAIPDAVLRDDADFDRHEGF